MDQPVPCSGDGVKESKLDFHIRLFDPADAEAVAQIFFDSVRLRSVRLGAVEAYDPAQLAAWAPSVPEADTIIARARDGRIILVATDDCGPIAYGDLMPAGEIDHLYCRPDKIGAGVGSALYDRLENLARRRGDEKLHVAASEVARPMFLRKNFIDLGRKDFGSYRVSG